MKIRDAKWECENLGLNVVEIEFETGEQNIEPRRSAKNRSS